MSQANYVVIQGWLVQDAETSCSREQEPVTTFRISHRQTLGRRGQRREDLSFWDVVTFGPLAVSCRGLKSGQEVTIEGLLTQQTIMKDSREHRRIEIRASKVHFIGRPGESAA